MKKIFFAMVASVVLFNFSFSQSVFAQVSTGISSIQYWFDDYSGAISNNSSTEFDIDCSSLSSGIHTLHMRVSDSNGRYSSIREHTFLKVEYPATATSIASYEYWIDSIADSPANSTEPVFVLDCKSLKTGIHTLNYRARDNEGKYSPLKSHTFLKITHDTITRGITHIQYWWDDLKNNILTEPYDTAAFVLSTEALPYGLHSLNYRVKDNTDRWSECHSHYFYKGEQLDSARIASYSYWWNDMKDKVITKQFDSPTASFSLDDDFSVPDDAKTNYAGHYTATLNFVITDNRGRSTFVSSDVQYPDNDKPATDIDADKYVASTSVTLTWEEKTNDKMGDYNVYVSKDNGPFLLWLPDTTATTATFKGEHGCTYLFTVTGRDAFGNRENYDETKCVSVTFE